MPQEIVYIGAALGMALAFLGIGALLLKGIDRIFDPRRGGSIPMIMDPYLKKKNMDKYRPAEKNAQGLKH